MGALFLFPTGVPVAASLIAAMAGTEYFGQEYKLYVMIEKASTKYRTDIEDSDR